jgi:D-tagatose-1,6-bisphosphate aldolase subunit GatZ/KbaZ
MLSTDRPGARQHGASPVLRDIFDANRQGLQRGIHAVCSAHELVLEAAFEHARDHRSPLLVEATCNQVNHRGGYTGMTPADFHRDAIALAERVGLPLDALVLGGDHLGPNPWRHLPARAALDEAKAMIAAYVEAGFTKIHLDASMACADDADALTDDVIAERAAELCAAAEAAGRRRAERSAPVYVIGTEVPTPGGETSGTHAAGDDTLVVEVTRANNVAATLDAHRVAFAARGLQAAWERVVAVVAQPGVEFDNARVLDYDPSKAAELGASILRAPNLVFEAHSTDYQTEAALAQLVRDHFAILKVGPALTFALREALFALSYIEDETFDAHERSRVRDALETAMLAQPEHWARYYPGSEAEQRIARRFSYSDRARYYWPVPPVAHAVARLFANLARRPPPETLVAQWLPDVYDACRNGTLSGSADPRTWARHHVRQVVARYTRACSMQ